MLLPQEEQWITIIISQNSTSLCWWFPLERVVLCWLERHDNYMNNLLLVPEEDPPGRGSKIDKPGWQPAIYTVILLSVPGSHSKAECQWTRKKLLSHVDSKGTSDISEDVPVSRSWELHFQRETWELCRTMHSEAYFYGWSQGDKVEERTTLNAVAPKGQWCPVYSQRYTRSAEGTSEPDSRHLTLVVWLRTWVRRTPGVTRSRQFTWGVMVSGGWRSAVLRGSVLTWCQETTDAEDVH